MKIKFLLKDIRTIIHNYQRIVKISLFFLFYLTIIILSSLAITLPLWYIATRYGRVYTIIVILTVLVIIGMVLTGKLKEWILSKQKSGFKTSHIIMIPLKKAGIFVLFLLGFYGIIFAYSMGLFIMAIILTICYLLILGYFIFISRKNNAHNSI